MLGLWRLKQALRRRAARAAHRSAEKAVERFSPVHERQPHGLPSELIVSLTSYPARYPTLAKTLKSLLSQDMAADRIILWIAPDDLASLPADVRMLEQHGLRIMVHEDLRAFTKLVPSLLKFPAATIVTADDDIYYPKNWLRRLVDASRADPEAIVAHRAHLALVNADRSLRPYAEWEMATDAPLAPKRGFIFPTGVGGVLYPPGALDPRVTDTATFRKLCPLADDVWFFWMARLNGTKHKGLGKPAALIEWGGSQETGLLHANWLGGENDVQIRAMEEHFGYVVD